MARKKNRRKLTDDQKRWLASLQELVKRVKWTGDQDLKEAVEGRFAVLHADTSPKLERDPRTGEMKSVGYVHEPDWEAFDIVVGADDYAGAQEVARWNPNPRLLVVDLDGLQVMKDVRKNWK